MFLFLDLIFGRKRPKKNIEMASRGSLPHSDSFSSTDPSKVGSEKPEHFVIIIFCFLFISFYYFVITIYFAFFIFISIFSYLLFILLYLSLFLLFRNYYLFCCFSIWAFIMIAIVIKFTICKYYFRFQVSFRFASVLHFLFR